MLAGLTPNYRKSTILLKYYIEKYYYTESTTYIYTHTHSLCIYSYTWVLGLISKWLSIFHWKYLFRLNTGVSESRNIWGWPCSCSLKISKPICIQEVCYIPHLYFIFYMLYMVRKKTPKIPKQVVKATSATTIQAVQFD